MPLGARTRFSFIGPGTSSRSSTRATSRKGDWYRARRDPSDRTRQRRNARVQVVLQRRHALASTAESAFDFPVGVPALIRDTPAGVEIDVRIIPRAKRNEISGVRGEAVLVRLSAPPVEGAANQALVVFLAERLGIPRQRIRILSGEHARQKRLAIAGVSADYVRPRLLR